MKKLLLALPLMFMACSFPQETHGKSVNKLDVWMPDHVTGLKLEKISEDIDYGLYKVSIDDTVHILFHRGVESCAMIQIK